MSPGVAATGVGMALLLYELVGSGIAAETLGKEPGSVLGVLIVLVAAGVFAARLARSFLSDPVPSPTK